MRLVSPGHWEAPGMHLSCGPSSLSGVGEQLAVVKTGASGERAAGSMAAATAPPPPPPPARFQRMPLDPGDHPRHHRHRQQQQQQRQQEPPQQPTTIENPSSTIATITTTTPSPAATLPFTPQPPPLFAPEAGQRSSLAPMVTMTSNGLPVPAQNSNYMENGRWYHGFRRGLYMYPCDEPEKDRMDIYHQFFAVARRNQLHQAPVQPHLQPRILDIGCGTGIWAIDMADSRRIPPNLRFRVPRDYESPWTLGEDSWDLIHLRMACGSVTSWPELYQKIYSHLKPGTGWIEHIEIDMEPRCDDYTLPPDSMLRKWYGWLADATQRVSRPIAYEHRTRQLLQAAGFIDIQETVIRVPYNTWPNDPHQKDIGRWYNLGLTEGLEALTFAPLTRVYQWDLNAHVRPIVESVRRELCNRKIHAYNNMTLFIDTVTGRVCIAQRATWQPSRTPDTLAPNFPALC
ncbi:s-adenosyl-l-methionine-dependent methyltransferase [Stemphylium lycopersici]|nr:s-adenosyl-l-methionine-dependent methyltransferase [Stemphylium lycopersici]